MHSLFCYFNISIYSIFSICYSGLAEKRKKGAFQGLRNSFTILKVYSTTEMCVDLSRVCSTDNILSPTFSPYLSSLEHAYSTGRQSRLKKNNYLLESSKFHHSVLVLECLSAQVLLECPSVQVLEGSSVFSARVPKCPLGVRVPQVTKCPSVLRVPHFSLSAFRVKKVWNITGSGLVNNFLEFLERILIHKLYYFLLPQKYDV